MALSKRAKIAYFTLFTGAIILSIVGILILYQAYGNNNNYPTDLKNGQTLIYSYSATYKGSDVGGTYLTSDTQLTLTIVSIGANSINVSVENNWTFASVTNSTLNYTLISTRQGSFPYFAQRDDATLRFSLSVSMGEMPMGEYVGWAPNPRYFKVGYMIGEFYINKKQAVTVPDGVFGTYELIKHQVQVIDNILIENKTTLYVEQVTGVIVQSSYYSNIKNLTSNTDLYLETETSKLAFTSSYVFPLLSGMVLFLNLADPIILFLEQYLIIILLIVTVILIIYLWKRSSGFRKD